MTRSIRTVALMAFTGWLALAPAPAPATDAGQRDGGVHQTDACFTVQVPGDPHDHQVSGTLFHRAEPTRVATVVLLLHGAEAERGFWDGMWPSVRGAPSMARELARAGYGVIAIDRLGYGRSTYDGSGYVLTKYAYMAMTHDIVTQLRAGTYRTTTGACDHGSGVEAGSGVDHVVLSGISSGAAIAELYATRYHDIAGIIPIAWSNQGASDAFGQYFATQVVPQLAEDDHVATFPDPDACARWLFHPGGARPSLVEQFCTTFTDPETRQLAPAGETADPLAVMQDLKASVGLVGPTPVLLVFAERDAIFPADPQVQDVVRPEIEMWTSRCGCPVSSYIQPDAGHAALYHRTAGAMFEAVVGWLRTRGL